LVVALLAILMKPPQVIEVQLVDRSGRAIQLKDVSVSVDFFLHGAHRYGFRFGPTDEGGHIRVSYDDVERRRQMNLHAQPWDYKTTLDETDPKVQVSVPPQDELRKAAKIATSFNLGTLPPDAAFWLRANNDRITCQPADATLNDDDNILVTLVCDLR
jgi:hypothetical protein